MESVLEGEVLEEGVVEGLVERKSSWLEGMSRISLWQGVLFMGLVLRWGGDESTWHPCSRWGD